MASKRRLRRKKCTGKIQHATEADADYAAFLLRKSKGAFCNRTKVRFVIIGIWDIRAGNVAAKRRAAYSD